MTTNSSETITTALANQMVQNTNVHLNVGQNTIIITEDKVRLCLIEHLKRVEARRQWIAPAGILLTFLITFPTTQFQDAGWFSAAEWKAMFVVASVLTFAWLIVSLISAWKAPSVDDIVAVMKKASAASPSLPKTDAT